VVRRKLQLLNKNLNQKEKEEMSNSNLYSDGIANIGIVDGVVRYDLVTMNPTDEKDKFSIAPVTTVTTSMQGMLRTYDQLSKAINEMVEKGVLKKTEPSAPVVDSAKH